VLLWWEEVVEPALARRLGAQHGVVSRAWLRQNGLTDGRVRTLLANGTLIEVHRGVYRTFSARQTDEQRIVGAALRYGAAASHTTAGRMWGMRKLGPAGRLEISVERARSNAVPAFRVHACRSLEARDLVRRTDGVVLTAVPRTVFDLAARLRPHALESVIEQCLAQKLCTFADLVEVDARLGRPGRNGSARFAEVLGSRDGKARPVASDYEMRFTQAWQAAGLPALVRQMPLVLPCGQEIHPDFAEPTRRFLVEVDHRTWHGGHQDNMNDRWRDRQCHLLGWHTERVSDDDIDLRLRRTLAELARIYRALPLAA
jgi:hypothetical protein